MCRKEAERAYVAAEADAKLADNAADAERCSAREDSGGGEDAAADKRGAAYSVAKKKCDAFAGDTKAGCIKDAEAR